MKVQVIRNYPTPATPAELHSFVCMVGFYSDFIPNLKEMQRPLQEMISKKDMTWTPERSKAFEATRSCVSNKVALAQPDFDKKFYLETDASKYAVGGVLYQLDEKEFKRPIMWMGRKLAKPEVNYCTRDQELLAVLYCIERCRMYLYGRHFIVRTDHLNLCWLYDNDQEGRVARWAIKLNAYDFDIEHIKGKHNVVADGISRIAYPTVASALTVLVGRPTGESIEDDYLPRTAVRFTSGDVEHIRVLTARAIERPCCEEHKDEALSNEFDEMDNFDAERNQHGDAEA